MSLAARISERRNRERKTVEVEEWGEEEGSPLTIYFGPMLALEMDRLQRKNPKFFENATVAGMVDLIIMKAQDKDGESLFTLEDKAVLMREDWELIVKVGGAMIASRSVEDYEKN